jgi:hypothetical protein
MGLIGFLASSSARKQVSCRITDDDRRQLHEWGIKWR